MNRILISLILLLFTSTLSAQSSIDGFMKLFDWVNTLDKNISLIVKNENKQKLVREMGYLQADIDDFIEQKQKITEEFIAFCEDTLGSINEVEKEINKYNKEIPRLIKRLEEIRSTITFEDDFYFATETKVIKTVQYKEDSLQENSIDVRQLLNNSGVDREILSEKLDTIEVTTTNNKYAWKKTPLISEKIDINIKMTAEEEIRLTEISLRTKGRNITYIKDISHPVKDATGNCNMEIIFTESDRAIEVLTNIRNHIRNLKSKIENYQPD